MKEEGKKYKDIKRTNTGHASSSQSAWANLIWLTCFSIINLMLGWFYLFV